MNAIVIFGAGSYAKVVIDIVEKQGIFKIEGLLDDDVQPYTKVFDYCVLGDASNIPDHICSGIVAIGDNWSRKMAVEKIRRAKSNFTFVSAIHPSAIIGRGVSIGAGSTILAGGILNSGASLGEHSIIATHASVDHDSLLGDFVSLAPGAVTGGNVTIGEYSSVGVGAKIIHGRSIGQHCVIGAGAVVIKDVESYCVQYGVPAKFIRSRNAGDSYL